MTARSNTYALREFTESIIEQVATLQATTATCWFGKTKRRSEHVSHHQNRVAVCGNPYECCDTAFTNQFPLKERTGKGLYIMPGRRSKE
jgi:hypothetical protein